MQYRLACDNLLRKQYGCKDLSNITQNFLRKRDHQYIYYLLTNFRIKPRGSAVIKRCFKSRYKLTQPCTTRLHRVPCVKVHNFERPLTLLGHNPPANFDVSCY